MSPADLMARPAEAQSPIEPVWCELTVAISEAADWDACERLVAGLRGCRVQVQTTAGEHFDLDEVDIAGQEEGTDFPPFLTGQAFDNDNESWDSEVDTAVLLPLDTIARIVVY